MPKLLAVSDDCRYFSGVALQSRKVLRGLVKANWDVAQIGYTRIPHSPDPVTVDGIRVYPVMNAQGYNDAYAFRVIMQKEKPDIVWIFNDPRFYSWLFDMDCEIRPFAKIVYWHLWDNGPFPLFNVPWYKSVDEIVAISFFTHTLLEQIGISAPYIPHGYDPKEFFRVSNKEREKLRNDFFTHNGLSDIDFIIFVNSRNLERKRLADIIVAYKRFFKTHPKSLLILHTDIIDPEGPNLQRVAYEVEPGDETVIFAPGYVTTKQLRVFYNISDIHVTIPFAEGFGLTVGESLLCGTPVIATRTGGIVEQMDDGSRTFGWLVEPTVRTVFGNPRDAYIWRDYVSIETVVEALVEAYDECHAINGKPWEMLRTKGRQHIIDYFSEDAMVEKWVTFLNGVLQKPKTYYRYELIKV